MRPVAAVLVLGVVCCAVAAAGATGKDFHEQDLKNRDFSNAALDGANFSDASLNAANFSHASLKQANFNGASIEGVIFNSADLTGADLRGTVGEANYGAANLTRANLEGLTFKGFGLGDCKCRGANFRQAKIATSVYRCDFRGADFSGASLRAATIDTRGVIEWKGAIYDDDTAFPDGFDPIAAGLVLTKTDKTAGAAADKSPPAAEAAPAGKDFHDQNLKNKDFSLASLNGANFTDATLTGANFRKASVKRAVFSGASIQDVSFVSADLTGADLRGTVGEADYRAANMTNANFEGLSFQGFALGDCNCRGANFKKAKIATAIYRCNFRGADFSGASLRGATIDTRGVTEWKGAIYDDDTAFPDGFDPKAAGLVFVKAAAEAAPPPVPSPSAKPDHAAAAVPSSPAPAPAAAAAPAGIAAQPPATVVKAAPPPPPALVAEKGDLQLNGLYFQISSLAVGGRMQMTFYYYYFLPDGHVFYGIPPGGTVKPEPTGEDVAALMKAAPKNLGVYKVSGDQITIQFPGGKPRIDKRSIQKNGDVGTIVVNATWTIRQGRFKDSQTFDARYATTSTLMHGGDESHGGGDKITVSGLKTLDFHADGTFTGAGATDLAVTSRTLHTGSGSKSADQGKYQISGNTLTMIHADGKTETLTVFPQPDKDESPPRHININGVIYDRQG